MTGFFEKVRLFFSERFRDINRQLLYAAIVLILYGIFLIFAASPGVAYRTNRETFYFINRQLIFLFPTVLVLFGTAFLSFKHIRRLSGLVLVASLVCMVYVVLFGTQIQGCIVVVFVVTFIGRHILLYYPAVLARRTVLVGIYS